MIGEATEVLKSRRASLSEQAAAYRRRAHAWSQLAETLPHDPHLTPAALQAAADDLSRAYTLAARCRDGETPP
jgi:hypothetical protein